MTDSYSDFSYSSRPKAITEIRHYHQAIDDLGVSPGTKKAEIPATLLLQNKKQARAQGTFGRTHPADCGDEASKSQIRHPRNLPGNHEDFWHRHRQRSREAGTCQILSARARRWAFMAHFHRPHERQPLERRFVPVRVNFLKVPLGSSRHGPVHTENHRIWDA